jgi:uncharacterized protein YndB with AHSA1/START domain
VTVISVEKDFDNLTLTVVAQFGVPVEQVWQLWADPRKLERWWGPPSHPATVLDHDLTGGGAVSYVLTGPDGERSRGWWRVVSADPPNHLEFTDGFADERGEPVAGTPVTTVRVRLAAHGGVTRMVVRSIFESLAHMEQVVRLGAAEVFVQALGQMDGLLAG